MGPIAERLVVTVQSLFDDFAGGEHPERPPIPYFEFMKDLRDKLGLGPVHDETCGGGKVH